MEELSQVLADATASIEAGYFQLSIDSGGPIYRERVYCYELYHQMRLLWPAGCRYYLNGEVDKAAHPILREMGLDLAKPDLLVHEPGYMSGNHAVIEVKKSQPNGRGIRKDLELLSRFIDAADYERAIYLFYGFEADDRLLWNVRRLAKQTPNLAQIELWFHQEPGRPAIHCDTLSEARRAG